MKITHVINGLGVSYKPKLKTKYRIDGDDAYIALTKNKEAVISVDDLALATQFKWCYTNYGYAYTRVKVIDGYLTLYLHQLLMDIGFGMIRFKDTVNNNVLLADHINGVRTDNRRSNLRAVTHQENMNNTRPNIGRYYKQTRSRFTKRKPIDVESVNW